MPIFEYKCQTLSCSNSQKPVDLLVSMSEDKDNQVCTVCNKHSLVRQLSAPNGYVVGGISNRVNLTRK